MSLIQNTAWSASAAIVLSVGRFAIVLLAARALGVSEFGRFAFSQWLVDMAFLVFAFGVNSAAFRFFAEYRGRFAALGEFQRGYLKRSAVVVGLVAVASPGSALLFGQDFSGAEFGIHSGWSSATAAWALLQARAQGLGQFRRLAASNIGYVVLAIAGMLLMEWSGASSLSVVMLIMAISTIASAWIIWLPLEAGHSEVGGNANEINLSTQRQFAMNMWLTSLVSALVWSRGELSVVRATLDATQVALYSAALSLSSIAVTGTMLLTGALAAHVTAMWGGGQFGAAANLSRRVTDLLLVAAGALGMALIAFAPEIVAVAFGAAFDGGAESLRILGLGALGLASTSSNLLVQLKTNAKFNRDANLAAAVGLLGLAVLAVPSFGVNGAAMARTTTLIGIGAATMLYSFYWVERGSISLGNAAAALAVSGLYFVAIVTSDLGLGSRAGSWLASCVLLAVVVRDAVTHSPALFQVAGRVVPLFRRRRHRQ